MNEVSLEDRVKRMAVECGAEVTDGGHAYGEDVFVLFLIKLAQTVAQDCALQMQREQYRSGTDELGGKKYGHYPTDLPARILARYGLVDK